MPGERADAGPALRKPRHGQAIRHPAPRNFRGGQSGEHGSARPREASFHQPRAAPRGLRTVGSEIRTSAAQPAARSQERTGRRVVMAKATTSFVYVTYILSTPEKVFEAITKPEIARRYWGHENISDWKPGSKWEHVRANEQRTVELVGKLVEVTPLQAVVIPCANDSQSGEGVSPSPVSF